MQSVEAVYIGLPASARGGSELCDSTRERCDGEGGGSSSSNAEIVSKTRGSNDSNSRPTIEVNFL